MVKRVQGTVRYHDDDKRVTSEVNPKLSDLPKEVQEQESIQQLVYDDKEDDGPESANVRQVQTSANPTPEEVEEAKKESSKKDKDS